MDCPLCTWCTVRKIKRLKNCVTLERGDRLPGAERTRGLAIAGTLHPNAIVTALAHLVLPVLIIVNSLLRSRIGESVPHVAVLGKEKIIYNLSQQRVSALNDSCSQAHWKPRCSAISML